MKIIRNVICACVVLTALSTTIFAVENHNSSRSNKTYPISISADDFNDAVLTLLDEVESNILEVAPTMLSQAKATREREEAKRIEANGGTVTGHIKFTVKFILKVEAVD